MADRTAPIRQHELRPYRSSLRDLDHHVGIDDLSVRGVDTMHEIEGETKKDDRQQPPPRQKATATVFT